MQSENEEHSRLVDFDRVDTISPMIYPPQPVLVVSGHAPVPGMDVTLVPLTYVSRPPFWGVQVVGTPSNGGTPDGDASPNSYSAELDLAGAVGTHGVEVIGATRTIQLLMTIDPESSPEGS